MKVVDRLRQWWQWHTGEEDTPFDGDSSAWLLSLMFHLALLITVSVLSTLSVSQQLTLTLSSPVEEEELLMEVPQEFYFDIKPSEEIGANSISGTEMALAEAPEVSEISVTPSPEIELHADIGQIEIQEAVALATGPNLSKHHFVKGATGVGTTGAIGAIDRITHEILLSLDERKTLVVWMFDQSGSLARQRETIRDRFDRIYEELGVIEASGNQAFSKHDDKPLLTSVMAFGQQVTFRTEQPTDELAEIKDAVTAIELDESGIEKAFSAIYLAVEKFKSYRKADTSGEPRRNVMLIAVTDEVGDDQDGLDHTIDICRRFAIPVYVVGVPAPFGQRETLVKWIDLDPEYDQTPQWGRVNQGPESLASEHIRLHYGGSRADTDPIDSGFGPFALTRLSYETGGIYFAVHPNRTVQRTVGKNEIAAYSAYIKHFFDPQVMRKYRPDYVSVDEYRRRLAANKARVALVQAAEMARVSTLKQPELKFVKRSDAALVNALTEAQKAAAKVQPRLDGIYEVLKAGEPDRPRETTPRWRAGYDLAMGRVMASKVRADTYNALLALAKQGMPFAEATNNTWTLEPDTAVHVGSQFEKLAEKARFYLQRVIDEHPGTPWALLAQRELAEPLSWRWGESFTNLAPRVAAGGGGGGGRAPRNDRPRVLEKPVVKKRPVPRL